MTMNKKGFTLIEMMIVLGIVVIIGVVASFNLFGKRSASDLAAATKQIGTLLRQAQGDSLAEEQGASWGVHFDNTNPITPFYSLFSTTNGVYSSSSETGHYPLPSDLCYASSTVSAGATLDVIFNALSGSPTTGTSTLIGLQVGGCGTGTSTVSGAPTVTQAGSGKIFFDDFNRANL